MARTIQRLMNHFDLSHRFMESEQTFQPPPDRLETFEQADIAHIADGVYLRHFLFMRAVTWRHDKHRARLLAIDEHELGVKQSAPDRVVSLWQRQGALLPEQPRTIFEGHLPGL